MQKFLLPTLVVCLVVSGCSWSTSQRPKSLHEQIASYDQILEEYPQRYPVRVALGRASLELAQLTLDPQWVIRARTEFTRSLNIQPTYEAYLALAGLENFAHRFEKALDWAREAERATPTGLANVDIQLVRFEAWLGLGQHQEAAKPFPATAPSAAKNQYEWLAAQARLATETGKLEEAALLFGGAAERALALQRPDLAGWARVQQAGCYLDQGMIEPARPILESADQLIPQDPALAIHWGEYYQALGQWEKAATVYADALKHTNHPLLHHMAWRASLELGRADQAQIHFQQAENAYRRAVDAGELYTLGALARLYADAEVRLDEAMELARLNFQHVKDAEARQTFVRLQKMMLSSPPDGTAP